MTRHMIGAGLALAAYVLLLGTAETAPMACANRAEMVAHLAGKYGEVRVGQGVTAKGSLTEVFVGAKGTWTILVSSPGGRACVVAVGEAWQGETGPPLLSPKVVPGAERAS